MRTPDEHPRHRTDHLQRHGRRDRDRRQLLQGSRLCRMARAGSEANLDRGPHDPRQNIEARQSLPARPVRAAAWVVLVKVKPNRWEGHGLKPWIEAAKRRLHHNVLAIALAEQARAHRVERSCSRSSLRGPDHREIQRTGAPVGARCAPIRSRRCSATGRKAVIASSTGCPPSARPRVDRLLRSDYQHMASASVSFSRAELEPSRPTRS